MLFFPTHPLLTKNVCEWLKINTCHKENLSPLFPVTSRHLALSLLQSQISSWFHPAHFHTFQNLKLAHWWALETDREKPVLSKNTIQVFTVQQPFPESPTAPYLVQQRPGCHFRGQLFSLGLPASLMGAPTEADSLISKGRETKGKRGWNFKISRSCSRNKKAALNCTHDTSSGFFCEAEGAQMCTNTHGWVTGVAVAGGEREMQGAVAEQGQHEVLSDHIVAPFNICRVIIENQSEAVSSGPHWGGCAFIFTSSSPFNPQLYPWWECSDCSADTCASESLVCTEVQGLVWGVGIPLGLYTIRLSRPHSAGMWTAWGLPAGKSDIQWEGGQLRWGRRGSQVEM